jgi:hypothetical protein
MELLPIEIESGEPCQDLCRRYGNHIGHAVPPLTLTFSLLKGRP